MNPAQYLRITYNDMVKTYLWRPAMIPDMNRSEGLRFDVENAEKTRCDTCNRELKTCVEWIRINKGVICDTCYQSLLVPNLKIGFEE